MQVTAATDIHPWNILHIRFISAPSDGQIGQSIILLATQNGSGAHTPALTLGLLPHKSVHAWGLFTNWIVPVSTYSIQSLVRNTINRTKAVPVSHSPFASGCCVVLLASRQRHSACPAPSPRYIDLSASFPLPGFSEEPRHRAHLFILSRPKLGLYGARVWETDRRKQIKIVADRWTPASAGASRTATRFACMVDHLPSVYIDSLSHIPYYLVWVCWGGLRLCISFLY